MPDEGQAAGQGMTIRAAAAYLSVSVGSIRRWCDEGHLDHWRTPGGQRRFTKRDLDAFVADGRQRLDG